MQLASTYKSAENAVDSVRALIQPSVKGAIIDDFSADVIVKTSLLTEFTYTDNVVEDLSFATQNYAKKPRTIVLEFLSGEIHYKDGNLLDKIQSLNSQITSKIQVLDSYLPINTASVTSKISGAISTGYTTAKYYEGLLNEGESIANIFDSDNGNNMTRQQSAYNKMLSYADKPLIITLPWVVLTNMVITSIGASRQGQIEGLSSFTVSLKEIKIAQSSLVDFDPSKFQSGQALEENKFKPEAQKQNPSAFQSVLSKVF